MDIKRVGLGNKEADKEVIEFLHEVKNGKKEKTNRAVSEKEKDNSNWCTTFDKMREERETEEFKKVIEQRIKKSGKNEVKGENGGSWCTTLSPENIEKVREALEKAKGDLMAPKTRNEILKTIDIEKILKKI